MKSIAVVLSTYNGERFIREQLDSLISQIIDPKRFEIHVYCRDDGSQDKTLSILQEYQAKTSLVTILNAEKNIGVKRSFLKLLKSVKADFYFFCDQDDIWYPDKISTFMKKFNECDNTNPGGVYSDLDLVDAKGKSLGPTMMSANHWNENSRSFIFMMFKVRVTGAAFAINRAARDKVVNISDKTFENVRMHDSLIALLASSFDNLYFINQPTVHYRQHGDNVVGAVSTKKPLRDIEFRRVAMRQCFFDLAIVKSLVSTEEIPKKNWLAINAAIRYRNASSRIKRWMALILDFKSLWSKVGFKRFVFFALYFQ